MVPSFTRPMNQTPSPHPILVTGGTGKTGRRVAAGLDALGLPVRIGSRHADIPFDWDDDGTWGPALEGIGAAYICYAPDVALPGAAEIIGSFSRQAVAAGVQRLVLLSGRSEDGAVRAEEFVKASGAEWTIVRCALFNQNFDEGLFVEAVQAGVLALNAGDVVEPFLDVDDIADVVIDALTDARHVGRLYELTGPRLLTFADAAAEIGAATGRPVQYVAGHGRGVPGRPRGRRPAGRGRRGPGLAVRRGLRRPQRVAGRRRAAGAGPAGPGLLGLRPPGGGHRRVEPPARPLTSPPPRHFPRGSGRSDDQIRGEIASGATRGSTP